MPELAVGGFAALAGEEVINSQRTIDYIRNFGLPIAVSEDCWCADIQTLLECTSIVSGYAFPSSNYPDDSTPSSDPAPWYDPSIPESGDFLGFLPTEFEGLGASFTRNTFDVIDGGAILGRLQPRAKTLTWRGLLFGRTCCAAQYGLRWLNARLAESAGCQGCDGTDLDILVCCPDVSGFAEPQACGPTESPTLAQQAASDAFRTYHRVGLLDGPNVLSERRIGCGGDCEDGPGCLIEVEFSLIAGNPFGHKDVVTVCEESFGSCDDCVEWVKVNNADECADLLTCEADAAACIDDPSCRRETLPTVPAFVDDCGCESLSTAEVCCEISAADTGYGLFFEGIPQIDIKSGSEQPLYNVTVEIYENPQQRDCDDADLFDVCNLCDFITVRYVPANSTLSIDGLTRTVDITCPGDNVNPAESLTVSPFRWPVFKCIDYIIKVKADCCSRPDITFVRAVSSGIDIVTFDGQATDILRVQSTAGFPASGTATVEVTVGGELVERDISYTSLNPTTLIGVNSNGQSGVLSTGNLVTSPNLDPDCTQGVPDDALVTIKVISREM